MVTLILCLALQEDPLPGNARRIGSPTFRHAGNAYDLAFSPDGKRLFSTGADHTLRCWDFPTGRLVFQVTEGDRCAGRLSISKDGRTIAGCGSEFVALWEASSGKELRRQSYPQENPTCLAFSHGGSRLAFGTLEGRLRTLRSADLREEFSVASVNWIHSVSWSRDDATIAVTGDNPAIQLLSARDGSVVRKLSGHRPMKNSIVRILSAVFFPDRPLLASSALDDTVRIWDLETGLELRSTHVPDLMNSHLLALSPDGRRVAVSCPLGIWLVDSDNGEPVMNGIFEAAFWSSTPYGIAFSPDGRHLAAATDHGTVRIWEANTCREIAESPGPAGPIVSLAFLGRESRLTALTADRRIRSWVDSREEDGGMGDIESFDGRSGLACDAGGRVHAMNSDGKMSLLFRADVGIRPIRQIADAGNAITVFRGGTRETVELWARDSGKLLESVPVDVKMSFLLRAIRVSPSGKRIALDCLTGVKVWDRGSGKFILALETEGEASTIFWTDDRLIVGTEMETPWVVDVMSGRKIFVLSTPNLRLRSAALSRDGRLLACSTTENSVVLVELSTGKRILEHRLDVPTQAVALSRDSSRLACGYGAANLLVWRLDDKSDAEPEKLWRELGSDDAATAWAAAWTLSRNVPYLSAKLAAISPDVRKMNLLLSEMESDDIDRRNRGEAKLTALVWEYAVLLREALPKQTGAVRERVEALLAGAESPCPIVVAEALRRHRAIQALELSGSKEAADALEKAARSSPLLRERLEAEASRRRIQ